MFYEYKCPLCDKQTTIEKPIKDSDRTEHCETCESELKRVYEAAMIKTADGVKR